MRTVLVASLLLLECLSARADIIRYRGSDGRLYFTNTSPVRSRRLRASVQSKRAHTLQLIDELAQQYNVEPRLLQAIIRVESNFNSRAVSHAGAQGLMQLMPATAKRYQVEDPFNPRANIEGGIRHLKHLQRRFPGDMRRVLAAYNAGEGVVQRYGGVPPYPETQRYVDRIMALYEPPHVAQKIYRYRTPNGSIMFTDIPH